VEAFSQVFSFVTHWYVYLSFFFTSNEKSLFLSIFTSNQKLRIVPFTNIFCPENSENPFLILIFPSHFHFQIFKNPPGF